MILLAALSVLCGPVLGQRQWMKDIPDTKLLSELSVPGTHQSYARYNLAGVAEPGIGACQDWTVPAQLERGIRFFDVRLKIHLNETESYFAVHHGVINQRKTFGQVMRHFQEFLEKHPSETLLVRYKNECLDEIDDIFELNNCRNECYDRTCNRGDFDKVLQGYKDSDLSNWSEYVFSETTDSIPTLGQTRGKVVFINLNFDGNIGLRRGLFNVEDNHDPRSFEAKINGIRNNLNEANSSDKISVTFFSSTYPGNTFEKLLNTPLDIAKKLHRLTVPAIANALNIHSNYRRYGFEHFLKSFDGSCGVVAFDYPTQAAVDVLISKNRI